MIERFVKKKVYLAYLCCFLIVGFFAFFFFLYYGKTTLLGGDGFDQYYPIVANLRSSLGSLVRGEGFDFWSWTIGLGTDRIASTYSVCLDPFTYIMVLFPTRLMDIGFGVSEYIRMFCAGLTMLVFLRSRRHENWKCLIGAISYTFCMWAMVILVHMIFYLPMILFPLLILAIYRIDEGKNPLLFIIVVAIIFISNLYFAYMSIIIAFVFFLIKYFVDSPKKSVSAFFLRLAKTAGYTVIAVLIACPVIVVVALGIMHSPVESGYTFSFFYSLQETLLFIPSFVTDIQFFNSFSAVSVCSVILAMLPAFVIDLKKKEHLQSTLMFWICFIFLAFPIFGSILNGFNYPTARWAYAFAFFFIWAGCDSLSFSNFSDKAYRKSYCKTGAVLLTIVVVITIVDVFLELLTAKHLTMILVNIIMVGATSFVLFHSQSKRTLIILTAASISLIMIIHFSSMMTGAFSDFMPKGVAYKKYQTSLLKKADLLDSDLYRTNTMEHIISDDKNSYATAYHWPANESLFFNVPTDYSNISIQDGRLTRFNQLVCNNPGYVHRVISYANDDRSRLNFLEDVRYFIASNEKAGNYRSYGFEKNEKQFKKKRIVYRNQKDTSLGYVFSYGIKEKDYLKLDYLGRQQALMQAVVLDDDYSGSIPLKNDGQIIQDTHEVPYQLAEMNGVEIDGKNIHVLEDGAEFTFDISSVENSELYVLLSGFKRIPLSYQEYKEHNLSKKATKAEQDKFDIKNISYLPEQKFSVFISTDKCRKRLLNESGYKPQAITSTTDYLTNMGYYEKTDGTIKIHFDNAGEYQLDELKVYAVSQEHYDEQADVLSANRLIVTDLLSDCVKGHVDSDGGILFLSLLDNGGWDVFVDGEKRELIQTDIAFSGVELTSGKHEIELRYHLPYWPYTGVACVAGILLCAGVAILFQYTKRKKGK